MGAYGCHSAWFDICLLCRGDGCAEHVLADVDTNRSLLAASQEVCKDRVSVNSFLVYLFT